MFFDHLTVAKEDPIFGVRNQFNLDPREEKVFLTVGIYQNEKLQSEFLPVVRKTAQKVVSSDLRPDYLPIDGLPLFLNEVGKLLFSEEAFKERRSQIYGAQTVGGTSALRLGGDFLKRFIGQKIYLPDPTWANHKQIFENSGLEVGSYPYYDLASHSLSFDKLLVFVENLPEKSLLLFHACCHNPTGADLNYHNWQTLAKVLKNKKHLPFLDFAYQGFGDGVEEDAKALKVFLEMNLEFLVAYSTSKKFSLYKHR
ncbi:MAG: aminotransferase class I/II-fold pyridoxal phosphate-dependent enzyme, partial [Parachlamydiales bacterium]